MTSKRLPNPLNFVRRTSTVYVRNTSIFRRVSFPLVIYITTTFGGIDLANAGNVGPVGYVYDSLNRLVTVTFANGQQTLNYTYDAAGNILTKTVTVAEKLAPTLTIISPLNGATVFTSALNVTGTAADTNGASGILTPSMPNANFRRQANS